MTPEPKISDFLTIAKDAGHVEDKTNDYNRGGDYESLSGPNAILWSRQTQRDTDLWRACRFNDATGPELTTLGQGRYGIPRILDTRGQGTASLRRPTTAGGGGTIWRGTRIVVRQGGTSESIYYRTTRDTVVLPGAVALTVGIEAVKYGAGSKMDTIIDMHLADRLWDTSWYLESVKCEDGTRLEEAPVYRTRIRKTRLANRVGQEAAIIEACKRVGADNVALFRSDYAGLDTDHGLNFAYVGDLGYTGTANLVRACTLALRSVRVAGDNLQVLPLARTPLTVDVDVYLRASPYVLPIDRLELLHRQAILQYMEGTSGRFSYTISGIESAIARPSTDVQDVSVVSPVADAGVLVNGNFPDSLSRYFAEDNNIVIRYHGPE